MGSPSVFGSKSYTENQNLELHIVRVNRSQRNRPRGMSRFLAIFQKELLCRGCFFICETSSFPEKWRHTWMSTGYPTGEINLACGRTSKANAIIVLMKNFWIFLVYYELWLTPSVAHRGRQRGPHPRSSQEVWTNVFNVAQKRQKIWFFQGKFKKFHALREYF